MTSEATRARIERPRPRAVIDAEGALRATSTADLLTNMHSLTHRLHAADRGASDGATEAARLRQVNLAVDLRAMRRRIEDEVLRRTGDL